VLGCGHLIAVESTKNLDLLAAPTKKKDCKMKKVIEPKSKGKTLLSLKNKVSQFKVPELHIFDVEFFSTSPDEIISKITSVPTFTY
jgi:hypothetical protein